jgi:ribosomal protein L29
VVEHKEAEHDEIARILTVQRGVLESEIHHSRKQTITLHNRLAEKAVVYLRHTVASGYKLTQAPETEERMGNAHLFRVEVPAGAKVDVAITEATPVMKTTDLRSPEGLDLVKAFVSSDAASGPLKGAISELLGIHRDMANIEEHIKTTREQMGDYRQRIDELHLQIVTLRAVKSAGPLTANLEKKMQEMSDKLSKATVDVVSLEEQEMVAKVHFQDKVADLSLEKSRDAKDEKHAAR